MWVFGHYTGNKCLIPGSLVSAMAPSSNIYLANRCMLFNGVCASSILFLRWIIILNYMLINELKMSLPRLDFSRRGHLIFVLATIIAALLWPVSAFGFAPLLLLYSIPSLINGSNIISYTCSKWFWLCIELQIYKLTVYSCLLSLKLRAFSCLYWA